jgi:hypothetical protein
VTVYLEDLTRLVRTKVIECECGCWYWTGATDSGGYAKFKLRRATVEVHRYAYERLIGPIPEGLTLDHRNCTTRRCVNPTHMDVVTRSVNSTRANATKWHDMKFDEHGNRVDMARCPACTERLGSTATMGFGSHPNGMARVAEDWADFPEADDVVGLDV